MDLLMIGEGYTEAELPKFHGDAKRLMDALSRRSPSKPPIRLQRMATRPAVRRERRQPTERRRVSPDATVGRIQHLRF